LMFRHNQDWPHNNILASLMHAEDLMNEPFLCAYSDILFTANVVKRVLANPGEIVLAVDTLWLERYQHRSHHPPDDAEKVAATNGRVTRIHRGIDPGKAHGEYMCVAKFSATGAARLKEQYQLCRVRYAGLPFREAALFEKAYLIQLFQEMIEAGVRFAHADTAGQYMEIDTQQDFDLAQSNWKIFP
jgi:choline kinase